MNDILEKKSNKKVKEIKKNVEEKKTKNKTITNAFIILAILSLIYVFGKDNPEIVANIFTFIAFCIIVFGCFKSKINKYL